MHSCWQCEGNYLASFNSQPQVGQREALAKISEASWYKAEATKSASRKLAPKFPMMDTIRMVLTTRTRKVPKHLFYTKSIIL